MKMNLLRQILLVGIILIGMTMRFFPARAHAQSAKLQAHYVVGSCHSLDGDESVQALAQECEALVHVDNVTYTLRCFEGSSSTIFAGNRCKWPLPKEFNWILRTDGKGCTPEEWNDGLIVFGCLGDYVVSNAQDFPDGGRGLSHHYVPKPHDPKNMLHSSDNPQARQLPSREWRQCGFSTPETQLRVSPDRVSPGKLILRVQPKYPAAARNAHIQGTVVLCATIAKDGQLRNLRAFSGPEELIPSAMKAVEQWRYQPYLLNKEPVDVDSEIHVDFSLGR